ncbi:tetratricopeptide repeat protein [Prosthecobacter sp.]|uniref:tetratricopeptide repeat protein n=1 Tax=Prosthecobacter sp. TaxID=1965333 RepID=UPI00378460A2
MSRTSRQAVLLIFFYSVLAVAWGWRLLAKDAAAPQEASALDITRTTLASSLARAPRHLQQAAILQLATLPDHELQALHAWLKGVPEQRLRQLTVQQGPVHTPCPLHAALVFVELSRADAPLIDDSHLLISASGDRLGETHKIEALELLASQAINAHEMNLAVEIHERVCDSPAARWPNVLHLTEAARLARRPAAALRIVNQWLEAKTTRLDESQRESALDLQITLLLEGTRYAEASRIALDALRALQEADAIPLRHMERALLATRAAGESAELLPWIERQLRTCPEHRLSLADLASGKGITAGYRRWLHEGAAIADLNHQTSIACELFFRLAAMGETRVLARLQALAPQLGRGRELAEVLVRLQGRFSPLQLAQALADGDSPAAARALLIPHLHSSPQDREGWRLLAQIDIIQRGESAAPMLWESYLKRFPDDIPALQCLAKLQLAAAQYPQALDTLQSIPSQQMDDATLRRISLLATHLDDVPTAHRAQQLILSSAAKPAVTDVLALAATSLQHPDSITADAARNAALARLPAGTPLHTALTATPATGKVTQFSTAVEAK